MSSVLDGRMHNEKNTLTTIKPTKSPLGARAAAQEKLCWNVIIRL